MGESRPRWPSWLTPVVMPLLIAAVLAVAALRIDYAANYQPLAFDGGLFGPATPGFAFDPRNGRHIIRLDTKPGQTATFMFTVTNTGSDPVTLLPFRDDSWSSVWESWTTESEQSVDRPLPVRIGAHQAIVVRLSFRRPACPPDSAFVTQVGLPLHYRAFGFEHSTSLPLGNYNGPDTIDICGQSSGR